MGSLPGASQAETAHNRILAAAAGQAAASRSEAAAALLMLLTYIGATRSMGAFSIIGSQWQHMQQDVLPKVKAHKPLK